MPISDENWEVAVARGAQVARRAATAVAYEPARRAIILEFEDGSFFGVPADRLEGLRDASETARAHVLLQGGGTGLHWPDLDLDFTVLGLLDGLFGTRAFMTSQLGAAGGRARSAAKSATARENGRKGGRPRKKVVSDA